MPTTAPVQRIEENSAVVREICSYPREARRDGIREIKDSRTTALQHYSRVRGLSVRDGGNIGGWDSMVIPRYLSKGVLALGGLRSAGAAVVL